MNILLIQPPWPRPKKISDPTKYQPFPLIKLAAMYRQQGHKVALVTDNIDKTSSADISGQGSLLMEDIPFVPQRLVFTTVFSYWFYYAKECIEKYMKLFPNAEVHIGGVHASLAPDVYRAAFPKAYVHVGPVPEAEAVEPAWDLLPGVKTQILSWSQGCPRACVFCSARFTPYKTFQWDQVSPKIRMRRLILNDNNFVAHPDCRNILKNLANYKVGGKNLTSIEIQGGFDVRILCKNLDLIPLMKEARLSNYRIAWDGGMEMVPMIEACLEAFEQQKIGLRTIRAYMLYNHDLPFETIIKKLEYFEKWKVGPIHSRFRPFDLLKDGYIAQKKSQLPDDYYIHPGWTDAQVRAVGSLASDISRMCRAGVDTLEEVRSFYKKPSVADTIAAAA